MGTTNTLDLNNRVTNLEKAVSGGDSAQANKADIATEFNTTTAYTAGCFVYYGGKLYQFNADHAAGAWDPTDVVEANVTDQVVSNKATIDELAESYPADNVMLSDGVTSVQDEIDRINRRNLDGVRIAITDYTSQNPYVCPTDGYITLLGTANTESALYMKLAANNSYYTMMRSKDILNCMFVRKGSMIYCDNATTCNFNGI